MPAVREHPARALTLIYHDPAFAGAFSLYWTPEGLLDQSVVGRGLAATPSGLHKKFYSPFPG